MFQELLQTLKDPAARHAMLVHVPIVLGVLGVLPLIGLAVTGFRSRALKFVVIGAFLIGSAGAYLAADAGGDARHLLTAASPPLTDSEKADLHDHAELGDNGWIWMLIPLGLTAVTFVKPRTVRVVAGVLAIAGAVSVAVWAARTGQAGGRLVYRDGLGVPQRSPLPRTGP